MNDVGCAEFENDDARADTDTGQGCVDKRGEEKVVKVCFSCHNENLDKINDEFGCIRLLYHKSNRNATNIWKRVIDNFLIFLHGT